MKIANRQAESIETSVKVAVLHESEIYNFSAVIYQSELYKGNKAEKNLLKAKMLEKVWPQYAKTVIRFNRHHHLVDWKVFQKRLKTV